MIQWDCWWGDLDLKAQTYGIFWKDILIPKILPLIEKAFILSLSAVSRMLLTLKMFYYKEEL